MTRQMDSLVVFVILLALCLVLIGHYYPRLPDPLASHFGRDGTPDGWMSKASFLDFALTLLGIFSLLFVGLRFWLRKIPVSLINLPHRDYWLAPERREATLEFIARHLMWFGSATLALFADMFHQTFRVNLGQAGHLEHPVLTLVVYLVAIFSLLLVLLVKFGRRPDPAITS